MRIRVGTTVRLRKGVAGRTGPRQLARIEVKLGFPGGVLLDRELVDRELEGTRYWNTDSLEAVRVRKPAPAAE